LEFYDVGLLGLADPDAQVRLFAVRILDDYQDDELVPEFLRLLASDPAVECVRSGDMGAFIYLGELEEIDPKISRRLKKPSWPLTRGPMMPSFVRASLSWVFRPARSNRNDPGGF
jgi:hypothetical protein